MRNNSAAMPELHDSRFAVKSDVLSQTEIFSGNFWLYIIWNINLNQTFDLKLTANLLYSPNESESASMPDLADQEDNHNIYQS